jgi:pimeloyl-ACP methyl ester carboxylesterase
MAADVAGLIEGLGHSSAHVVGISMGGMVAQVLATEHPARVRTLTTIASTTGALRYVGRPRVLRALLQPAPRSREAAVENALAFFELVAGSRYPVDAAVGERAARAYDRAFYPRGFVRQLIAIVASGNRTRALRSVTAPTLVVHGSDDPLIPLSAGRATARAIPGAELWVIEGLGHHLPEAVWDELIERLAAHARRHRGMGRDPASAPKQQGRGARWDATGSGLG